ncbi:hypothetical protein [Streptomyces endophytica]|uniref:Uncharacterized protein n=1 Tax=Streptomyces endophytica TaxID=2991496 RepID=A0ABY6PBQ9_9ACTN|nr:hypothetical protein [Streptomyces endophytica]UZJ30687.1 hypothetical protein OJ254_10365 [Streptomyces endophytica]
MPLTESVLLAADDGRLEEVFRAAPAGEVPRGPMEGTAILGAGTSLVQPIAALVRLAVWRGKVFSPEGGYLSNRLGPFDTLAVLARVAPGPSLLDERECIVIDYSRTSLVAREVRDEIRQVEPGLYLGAIWLSGASRIGWFTLRTPETDRGAGGAPGRPEG